MTEAPHPPGTPPAGAYRPCVGIMLFNPAGRVFVARRADTREEAWQMPQGGIEPGEAPRDAALRELAEETGIAPDKAQILAESRDWLRYDLPDGLKGKLWGGKYVGQTQKWFAARFLGEDREIDLDAHIREFTDWRWVPIEDVERLIVPFKRALYREVVAEFRFLAAG